MTDRTIEVQHCGECPAHASWDTARGIRERCEIAKRGIEQDDPERPEWCPLEAGPITLRVKQ